MLHTAVGAMSTLSKVGGVEPSLIASEFALGSTHASTLNQKARTSQFAFTGLGAKANVPPAALDEQEVMDNGYNVNLLQYETLLSECLYDPKKQFVSNVYQLTLTNSQLSEIPIEGLSDTSRIALQLSMSDISHPHADDGSNQDGSVRLENGDTLRCEWLDYATNTWSDSGCDTIINGTTNTYDCVCEHLTDFAFLIIPKVTTEDFLSSLISWNDVKTVVIIIQAVFVAFFLCILVHSILRKAALSRAYKRGHTSANEAQQEASAALDFKNVCTKGLVNGNSFFNIVHTYKVLDTWCILSCF